MINLLRLAMADRFSLFNVFAAGMVLSAMQDGRWGVALFLLIILTLAESLLEKGIGGSKGG